MKRLILFAGLLIAGTACAQSYVLNFDGVDDYVDLGPDVGDNVRTIELWFMPNTDIDNTLPDFSALVWRECCGNNIEEFELAFMSGAHPQKGKLRFKYVIDMNNTFTVASDSDSWNKDQWYHVAAVIDPLNGMSLYIDGVKQVETNAFSSATTATNDITAIGRWGSTNSRHFDGRIDDVRFSSDAVYSNNFTPPCPNISVFPNSQGVWRFNEGTGSVAMDASGNGYDGTIYGATYVMDSICGSVGVYENSVSSGCKIFPNPTEGQFTISSRQGAIKKVEVYDLFGRKVLTTTLPQIDMRGYAKGVYFVRVGEVVRKLVLQ